MAAKGSPENKIKINNKEEIPPNRLDIRVGKIVKVSIHPEAKALYVTKVELGEEQPRTIVCELANFKRINEMKNRLVLVLCNLEPYTFGEIESSGMIICSSTVKYGCKSVTPLEPDEGSQAGDKVFIEGGPDRMFNILKRKYGDNFRLI